MQVLLLAWGLAPEQLDDVAQLLDPLARDESEDDVQARALAAYEAVGNLAARHNAALGTRSQEAGASQGTGDREQATAKIES